MLGTGSPVNSGKFAKNRKTTIEMGVQEIITLSLAASAGLIIGGTFFVGLWWTVLHGLRSKRPALLFIVSLLVRTSLVLTGFYFVSGGRVNRLLACLLGFLISRLLIRQLLPAKDQFQKQKATNAFKS